MDFPNDKKNRNRNSLSIGNRIVALILKNALRQ